MLYIEFNGKSYELERNQLNLTARMKDSFIKETLANYFKVEPKTLDRYEVEHGDAGELRLQKICCKRSGHTC